MLITFLMAFFILKGGYRVNDKAREQRNIYMREWRKRNKDKVKQAQERYWENKSKKEGKKVMEIPQ